MIDSSHRHRRWIVTQIGSRQHYAVPNALHACGQLERLYTDIWLRHGRSFIRRVPGPVRSMADRFHPALPEDKVTSFTLGGIGRLATFRQTRTTESAYESFLRTGEWFCNRVNRSLSKQTLQPGSHAAFLFNTGALETIHFLREQNISSIVDQIDPAAVEEEIVLAECEKWPGWQKSPGRIPAAYYDRLASEWAAADAVMVNSTWTRRALIQQGVASEKIHIVPQAYEPTSDTRSAAPRDRAGRPFTVLWIGQVILRKGIPYLFEAARQLLPDNIRFVVAGWVGITETGLQATPANVRLVGPITRSQTADLYRDADLFVLPTLSDGFAITQLEAMSFGLPVIATDRCGDVVSDQIDGLIVPPGNADALSAAIRELYLDSERMAAFSEAAVIKARSFSLARFAAGINRILPP